MSDFLMPSLGADMESAEVTEWLVKPGTKVKKGDVIVVVETHKGAIEVEVFQDGVVTELCAKEGDVLPVGAPLARIAAPGETAAPLPAPLPALSPTPAPPIAATPSAPPRPSPPAVVAVPQRPEAIAGRPKVSPAERRRAAELGIDADILHGTGIDGSVTLADVEATPRPVAPAPRPPGEEAPRAPQKRPGFDPAEMRKAIALAIGRSKREIPHYYLSSTIDLGRVMAWLAKANEGTEPEGRVIPGALLLKASALALRETPQLNGFWVEDGFRPGAGIHVG